MEDDDLAVVRNGALTIHRTQHEVSGQSATREIIELKIELQQIMKGLLSIEFVLKSVFRSRFPCRKLQIFYAKRNFRTA